MFGFRSSVAAASDIGLRLLRNTSFHGLWVQCFRLGNTEIPINKRLAVSLQHIHGVGRARANQILADLSMVNKPTCDLTAFEINSLREEVRKYMIGEDLKRAVRSDIHRLIDVQCYKGIRHTQGLPVRGQRTKTNARTVKGRGAAVPGKKKPTR
ncbi:small ribosomal subunit protein S13 mitochondrial-like isoform X2 [Tripterygium wilfordii]|uniref:Small ribosomal subunit protein S13 mitochondrial-like isoform X2 n=1 Tax=Tripterygium wilfordii TaxID=458696 RepID=A0A7J7D1R5_TRIWF|nr:small ribosomal subunit protein S13, mitochondrial [Tripterygium wilfordii]KAF5740287.1 small ribosomal subunit protein S13 mitochondrial-like isoform X2 [Tripterygium wilfordii]